MATVAITVIQEHIGPITTEIIEGIGIIGPIVSINLKQPQTRSGIKNLQVLKIV